MTEQKKKRLEDIKREAEEERCSVQKTLYYIEKFLSDHMCGKCFPCSFGTYEAKIRLKTIIEGHGSEADCFALRGIASKMLEASMCKKGKDTARFILEWMGTDFKEHIEGICPERECLAYIEYRIVPDKCTMCGECQVVCRFNAIIGEKKDPYLNNYLPFEIRQKRCTKCGECIKVCPTEAIAVVNAKERELVKIS